MFKNQFDLTKALMMINLPSFNEADDKALTATERMVLVHLSCYMNTDTRVNGCMWACPSQETMGNILNLTDRSIRATIKALESKGYISKQKRYNNSDKIFLLVEAEIYALYTSSKKEVEVKEEEEFIPVPRSQKKAESMEPAEIKQVVKEAIVEVSQSEPKTDAQRMLDEMASVGIVMSSHSSFADIKGRYERYQDDLHNSPF